MARRFSLLSLVLGTAETYELYRAVRDIPLTEINPQHPGKGVFGPGTYYAHQLWNAATYSVNFDWMKTIGVYDVSFPNILVLESGEVKGLGFVSDTGRLCFNPEAQEKLYGEAHDSDLCINGKDLGKEVKELGFDAVSLEGHVDGGEQVLIPQGSTVTPRLLYYLVKLQDPKEHAAMGKELGLKESGLDHEVPGYWIVPLDRVKDVDAWTRSKAN
jgi:hypothetical protein